MKLSEIIGDLSGKLADEGLSDYEKFMLVERAVRRLRSACFCDEGVCCEKHGKHSSPHQNCVLR